MQVNINQTDRAEFLNWRIGGIGASDIAQIMGKSPYGNYGTLLKEKITGESKSINSFLSKRGEKVEILGRAYAELSYGLDFQPCCFQDDKDEWKKASLDGWNPGQRIILEVKYVGAEIFNKTRSAPSVVANMAHYYLQMQWQLHVVPDAQFSLLCLIDSKNNKKIIKIERDGSALDFSVIDKFWNEVVEKRAGKTPEINVDETAETFTEKKELAKIDDEALEHLLFKRKEKFNEIKAKQDELKLIEENLRALPAFRVKRSFMCGEFNVLAVSKKGSVDYKTIKELEGVDLEKFRKPSTVYWKYC